MAKIRKIIIKAGVVSDVAVFDSAAIPSWADDDGWIDAPAGTSVGDIDNGDGSYSAPPIIPPTQGEIDAALDEIADAVMDVRGAVKALALTVLSEINILRTEAALAPRTVEQLKAAVRSNAG